MSLVKSTKDPFSTPVGHLIEMATIGTVLKEDWGQFNQICDIINTTEDGPKDAVKALKKRMSRNCNHTEIRISLSLLESCVQNCSSRFQSLVVKKEFCKDVLVKMLKPKYNPPVDVQNKILGFIMKWASGFPGAVDVTEVKEVYIDLIKKGIAFPSAEVAAAPLNLASSRSSKPLSSSSSSVSMTPAAGQPKTTITTLSPEQIAKLYSELDMVQININVMSTILLENTPGAENPEDLLLLEKLHDTCRSMQERIMELLAEVEMEEVTGVLLQMNDNLNNVFLRYERFSRSKIILSQNKSEEAELTEDHSSAPCAPVSDLIDLNLNSPAPRSESRGQPTISFQAATLNQGYANTAGPAITTPSLYPQLGLIMPCMTPTQAPYTSSGTQNLYQSTVLEPMYDNLSPQFYPPPSQPEKQNLPTFNASTKNQSVPGLVPVPCDNSGEKKSSPEATNVYDLLEFDPCAANDNNTSEAIYEDLEEIFKKAESQAHTNC